MWLKQSRSFLKTQRFHPYQRKSPSIYVPNTRNRNNGNHKKCNDHVNPDNKNYHNNGETIHIDGGDLLVQGWKESNASASEAIVKAERHSNDISTEELQKKTVDHVMKLDMSSQKDQDYKKTVSITEYVEETKEIMEMKKIETRQEDDDIDWV